jgi:hypothetical protein
MSKAKGVHTYTVQEAGNATMGQGGTAYVTAASGAFEPSSSSRQVVIAIQVIDDVTFTTLTSQDPNQCVGSATSTAHTNDTTLSGVSIPAGTTLFGRWSVVDPSLGAVICYLG